MAAKFGATRLRVFGSVARGEETADSDVDFLVVFPKGYDLLTQRMPLAQGLSDLLNRKVDLIPEHELNPHIKAQVLAEAVAL
jgi:predicted nucleotidyltransferase